MALFQRVSVWVLLVVITALCPAPILAEEWAQFVIAGKYSNEHDVVGISIKRSPGFKYSEQQLINVLEGLFREEGVPSKAFASTVEGPGQASASFYYNGIPYGPYHITEAIEQVTQIAFDYKVWNCEGCSYNR